MLFFSRELSPIDDNYDDFDANNFEMAFDVNADVEPVPEMLGNIETLYNLLSANKSDIYLQLIMNSQMICGHWILCQKLSNIRIGQWIESVIIGPVRLTGKS